jgi:hypothetical protein
VGGIFNRAIASGMFQNAHRATIEWMAGERHIVFVCLSRFLTILLILWFVIGREIRAERWYQDSEQDEAGVFSLSPASESITAGKNGNDHRPKVIVSAV